MLNVNASAQTTEVINQTVAQGWVFYDDETNKIDPTLGKFVNGPGTPPAGTGSVQFSVTGTQRKNVATYQFSGTVLSTITEMKFSTYNPSAGNGGSPTTTGYLHFNVDFNGSDTWQRRLVFVPNDNGSVIQDTWQEWDAINSGNGVWRYSGGTFPGPNPATTKTWSQILADYPGVRIRVTDAFFGIRVGNPDPSGYTENIDAIKFGVSGSTTTYDFEPTSTIAVSPATTPNFIDNDYTRINNAIQAIASGGTVTLNGTFDWTETNAAASWALGSDGQTGGSFGDDDYTVLAPANLNGVTFTANNLGDSTIQGPGDLAGVNLEGVIQFYDGGTNQNWTISNLRFVDFDNPIGFYFVGGPTSVYSGTQILNNYILTARDLNATVAPADSNQNIGIHFSFGSGQTISGNTIEVHGDGVSDTSDPNPANHRFSTEVGMQSNTSGGTGYEGLQITNNTIRVLNAQSANPQIVLGFWENGHAHQSNITVSGNQFLNLAAGNNPSVNIQRGFRITSHSSGTTSVNYTNNRVEGANAGMQFLSTSANTGPVNITSNVILNNASGVVTNTNGMANLSFNRIVGNSVAGVDNTLGSTVTAENNWWGCNYGPGAGGAGCSGTANGTLGTVDANPWLTLTTSASPNAIDTSQTSNVTSSLVINSNAVDTSGSGTVPDTTPATFAGILGSVSPTTDTTTAGIVNTTYTPSPTMAGAGGVNTTIDGQTVNAPITTSFTCNNVSIPTGQTVTTNSQFVSPINVDDTTGRNILSYDFTLTYNPAVVAPIAVETAGTMSAGWTITTNNSSGTLVVSGFNTSPLTGSGTLVNVRFVALGAIGTSSNLSLTAFQFNEGVPCVNTTNGSVTIISGTITGRVTYANAITTTPVPNATLNGAGSVPVSSPTDGSGNYTLSGFGTGAYTVTPSKTGQINGISNSDATAVAQHVVGFITLNSTQQIAADVTGNGTITSLDASYIAQYVALIPNPGVTGTWRFTPTSRSYPNVQTSYTNEDYGAILMGEVTGNWNPAIPFAGLEEGFEAKLYDEDREDKEQEAKTQPEQVVTVSAPNPQQTSSSQNFTVDLASSNTTGEGIFGYEFNLLYDPNVITLQLTPCDKTGTLSSGLSVLCNPVSPGFLRIVAFSTGANPISGAGTLLKVNFNATGSAGQTSPLTFQNFMFNEGIPQDITNDGQVQILSPTAAEVSLAGKVLSAYGTGVGNARITLIDSAGNARQTTSNQLGNYVFSGVEVGETYTVNVFARGYTFASQVVSVTDSIKDFDIIADQ